MSNHPESNVSNNVLVATSVALLEQFMRRCWVTVLTVVGYGILLYVDWRVALAIMALEWARSTADRMIGT